MENGRKSNAFLCVKNAFSTIYGMNLEHDTSNSCCTMKNETATFSQTWMNVTEKMVF